MELAGVPVFLADEFLGIMVPLFGGGVPGSGEGFSTFAMCLWGYVVMDCGISHLYSGFLGIKITQLVLDIRSIFHVWNEHLTNPLLSRDQRLFEVRQTLLSVTVFGDVITTYGTHILDYDDSSGINLLHVGEERRDDHCTAAVQQYTSGDADAESNGRRQAGTVVKAGERILGEGSKLARQ